MMIFGMSGGLSFFTLSAVLMFKLARSGRFPEEIGWIALCGLPYNIRFFWPILVDCVKIPYFSKRFGRRRSWGILAHVCSTAGFIIVGGCDPVQHYVLALIVVFITSFFSAVQDIISDAYRFDIKHFLQPTESVPFQTVGFRMGQFVATAVIPILSDTLGYLNAHISVVFIKVLALFFFILTFSQQTTNSVHSNATPTTLRCFIRILHDAFKTPFFGSLITSAVLCRCADVVIGPMQTIFIGQLGVSYSQYGAIKNGFGFVALLIGVTIAGYVAKRVNIHKALIFGSFGQSCSALLSLLLVSCSVSSTVFPFLLGFVSVIQEIFAGIMNTLLIVFISLFCKTATSIYQFTIFASIGSVGRTLLTKFFSENVNFLGWNLMFCFPIIVYLPTLCALIYNYAKTGDIRKQ
jgi:PAT family beta-lactamase induction signal transducer AmpG